jgi:hypothetical protein
VRGEAVSDVGLFIGAGRRWLGREPRTRSSCLPVNGGSGSSADGIRDGESTRCDGGAVGQHPTGSDAMDSEPGQRQARGGQRLAAATHWWPAMACLRGLARGTRDGAGDEATSWSGTRGLARRAARWGDGMAQRVGGSSLARCCWHGVGRQSCASRMPSGCCIACVPVAGVSAWRGKGFVLQACMHTAILDGEVCLACELACCCSMLFCALLSDYTKETTARAWQGSWHCELLLHLLDNLARVARTIHMQKNKDIINT